jgi:hypothetical protein
VRSMGDSAMQKTSQEQRHGDECAHTVVCKRSNAPPGSLRGGSRFVMALFFAILADANLADAKLCTRKSLRVEWRVRSRIRRHGPLEPG